jgi:hypothetical protein
VRDGWGDGIECLFLIMFYAFLRARLLSFSMVFFCHYFMDVVNVYGSNRLPDR